MEGMHSISLYVRKHIDSWALFEKIVFLNPPTIQFTVEFTQ